MMSLGGLILAMTSIGDTLRRQRQRNNFDIPKIARELKISTRFIEAMEQDDFAKLPGGVFTKSFVRQYASFLGLDAEELASEVQRALEPEPEVSQPSHVSRPEVPGIQMDGLTGWQSVGQPGVSVPSWARAGLLLVVLMMVCSGVYRWWQRPVRQVAARDAQPAPNVVSAAQPAPPLAQPAENPPVAAAQSAGEPAAAPPASAPAAAGTPSQPPAEPSATPPAPATAPDPNATLRVGVTAGAVVWIRAEVNGKTLFEGTLQPQESRTFEAVGQMKVRLGNAGGVTMTFNGKPIGPLGPKGQIRNVQFTSGGFQIVSPPMSFDPLDRL
jgi:cytoskeleton protein RodZ